MTFAIVFGVILYRISIKAALHISTYPAARSNIRATVKTTGAIINLIIIIILDEIYAAIARWLNALGEAHFTINPSNISFCYILYIYIFIDSGFLLMREKQQIF